MSTSRSQKAVAIAKDALFQLRRKKFVVGHETWTDFGAYNSLDFIKKSKDFIGFLNKTKKCTVCAGGALLCSSLNLYNNVKLESGYADTHTSTESVEHLFKYFDKNTITLLEHTYEKKSCWGSLVTSVYLEGGDGYSPYNQKPNIVCHKDFYMFNAYAHKKYPKQLDRITYLMKNIARNKGKLVIPREAYRLADKTATRGKHV
jgi:hypothetical protein